MKGRNRYKKKCYICGVVVPANEGYLKKKDNEYLVHHVDCEPKATVARKKKEKFSSNVEEKDQVLDTLEAKLIDRQMKGEPVIFLPKIIEYIKQLKTKIGFQYSITGDRTCKNCGECTGALDQ